MLVSFMKNVNNNAVNILRSRKVNIQKHLATIQRLFTFSANYAQLFLQASNVTAIPSFPVILVKNNANASEAVISSDSDLAGRFYIYLKCPILL